MANPADDDGCSPNVGINRAVVNHLPPVRILKLRHYQSWQRLLFDRSHMAIDAAVAGMGIALESNLMMWKELRDGLLICPIANPPEISLITQWVVCPHDHLRHSKVRAFFAWLKEESEAWAAQSSQEGYSAGIIQRIV